MPTDKSNVDKILTYVFLKKLVSPIVRTEAYKLGIVNNTGRVIKEPKTDKEKSSLTILDKTIFKLRRMLGSKISQLNNFLFLQTLSNDFYNKLVVRGSIEQRAEIKRIVKDVDKLAEKYDCEVDDILKTMLTEQIRSNDNEY